MSKTNEEANELREQMASRFLQGFVIVQGDPPVLVYADEGAAEIFLRSTGNPQELIGLPADRLGHPGERSRLMEIYESCLREPGKARSVVFSAMMPDGFAKYVIAIGMGCIFQGDRALAVGLVERDRQWDTTGIDNHDRMLYSSLVENAFDAIYLLHGKHYVYVNPRFCQITEYSYDELTDPGFDYEVLLPPKTSSLIEDRYRARKSGVDLPQGYTVEILTRSGRRAMVDVSTVSLAQQEGEVRVLGIMRDVTEREKARRELQESRRFLESVLSNVPGMVFRSICSEGGHRLKFISSGSEELTGYRPDELREGGGIGFEELIVEDDRQRVAAARLSALESKEGAYSISYRMRHRDGSIRHVWEHASVVDENAGEDPYAEGIVTDVTEMHRATRRYSASQSRLEAIVSSLQDLLFVFDTDGRFIHYYAPDRSDLVLSPSEFLGRHYSKVMPPEIEEKLDAAFRIARSGQISDFEYSLELGEAGLRHYMARLSPLIENGSFAGVISVSRDITSLVEAVRERRRIDEELRKAQKLESMGLMAGGIAHDFNNLLEGIIGQVDLALATGCSDEELEDRLGRIRSAASRASELSDKMLAFSGRGGRTLQTVDTAELVESMREFLVSAVDTGELILEVREGGRGPVIGDPSQLQQVVLNLVMNASEAVDDNGGRIVVVLDSVDMDRSQLARTYVDDDLSPGSYVRIAVSDNGCGMDAETAARVFDPFFTTKFTGRGLGLASVLGIVRGHGGAVSVKSRPGTGSTFTVLLPRILSQAGDVGESEHRESAGSKGSAPGMSTQGRGVVMVVDDEPIILETAFELISHLGYDVLTATSGENALELLAERSEDQKTISCVVLDVTMPGMDGYQTLEEIRRRWPSLPVVVSSGYSRDEIMPRFLEIGVSGFLHKPYTLRKVAETLKTLTWEGERGREDMGE